MTARRVVDLSRELHRATRYGAAGFVSPRDADTFQHPSTMSFQTPSILSMSPSIPVHPPPLPLAPLILDRSAPNHCSPGPTVSAAERCRPKVSRPSTHPQTTYIVAVLDTAVGGTNSTSLSPPGCCFSFAAHLARHAMSVIRSSLADVGSSASSARPRQAVARI